MLVITDDLMHRGYAPTSAGLPRLCTRDEARQSRLTHDPRLPCLPSEAGRPCVFGRDLFWSRPFLTSVVDGVEGGKGVWKGEEGWWARVGAGGWGPEGEGPEGAGPEGAGPEGAKARSG